LFRDINKHHRFATQKQFYFKTSNNVKKKYEQNVTVQTVNGSAAAGGGRHGKTVVMDN